VSLHNYLSVAYESQGRLAEAIELEKQTLESGRRVMGDEHPRTLALIAGLAYLYRMSGVVELATSLDIEAFNCKKRLQPDQLRMPRKLIE